MRYDASEPCVTLVGGDPRTEEGELMFPTRFTPEAVDALEFAMGGRGSPVAESQLQQRPAPPGGLIFKSETFLDFQLSEMPFANTFNVLSVDCSFKDSLGSDYVCIEAWGARLANFFNYDSFMKRMGLNDTIAAILHMQQKYPAHAILIEDKANGSGVIDTLKHTFPNILALDPKTSKLARAHAANVYFQAKSVKMLAGADWRARKENNLKQFPKGKNDDDVDATTMAVLYLASTSMPHFTAAVEAFKNEKSQVAKLLANGPMGGFGAHFTIR
jgi:predicted phage terminase large subunit-like protein